MHLTLKSTFFGSPLPLCDASFLFKNPKLFIGSKALLIKFEVEQKCGKNTHLHHKTIFSFANVFSLHLSSPTRKIAMHFLPSEAPSQQYPGYHCTPHQKNQTPASKIPTDYRKSTQYINSHRKCTANIPMIHHPSSHAFAHLTTDIAHRHRRRNVVLSLLTAQ